MRQLLKNIGFLAMCLFVVSFLGCEDDDDATLPEIVAGFTFTLNEETATVTFINISEEANNFEWDFGDGDTSTEINPTKTYLESGTYTISLEATNVAGASKIFEDEITIVILDPVSLPITFDDSTIDYSASVFGGASFEIVTNPDASGSNTTTSNVGAITNSGSPFEGIFFDLGTAIDFTEDKTIKMNFWSEVAIDLLLKLEEGTGADVEIVASHGGSGWEEVTFDFDSSASYSRFTFFVDGPGATAGTFYVDDVVQTETGTAESGCSDTPIAAAALPLDFESCDTFAPEFNFGSGITSELAQNPAKGGINNSDFVLKVDKPAGSDFFAGIQNTFADNFDLTTTDTFKAKIYSSKANVVFRFELALNPQTDPPIGNPAPVFVTIPNANEWTEISITFSGLPGGPTAYNQLVIKPDNNQSDDPITEDGTYYIDDLALEASGSGGFDSGLLTNGDFENGGDPWIGNALNVMMDGGNSFNFANVETAGQAFAVNLSQVVEITQGTNYILTFDASSDRNRTMLAGIGLNEDPFTNTAPTVNLTTETQTFTLQLAANDFGSANSRVLFDMGAAVGTVVIDNVSLVEGGDGSDTNGGGNGGAFDDGLLTNGDFENGAAPWIQGVDDNSPAPVVTENGNSFYSVNITNPDPGAPFAVNLSQKLEITPDATYTLTFDAWSDVNRAIIAGIGLSGGSFANTTESVNITATQTTYTLSLTANGFGDATSRVLFDVNGEAGLVNIDNVSLVLDSGGSGGGGGTGSEPGLPFDFENGENYFGAFENGATAQNIDNPQTTGNTSSKVLEFNKAVGSQWFSGIFFDKTLRAANSPLIRTDNGTVFKVKFWSPKAGINVRMRLQGDNDGDGSTPVDPAFNSEVTVNTANEWVTLTFDFTAQVNGNSYAYEEFVIQPDLDEVNMTAGDGSIYYIDDIIQE